jgi:hypothetical protein
MANDMNIPIAAPIYGREIEEVYDWETMLIYGDYGVGKTWLAGSSILVPDMNDVLYIALEGGEKGLKEIAKLCRKNGINPNEHMLVIPVQTYKQYAYIYEFLKYHIQFRDADDVDSLRKLEGQIRVVVKDAAGNKIQMTPEILNDKEKMAELIPNPKKFRTVITDSLTEAQKYCMYQVLGINPLTQKIDAEPDSAQWGDWGKSREMIQFLVRRYRDLPVHSIFICARDIEQDAAKHFHFFPMLPGKLADDVRGLVDTVGYLDKIPQEGGSVIRRLYLEGGYYGGAYIAAKHRFGSNLKGLWLDNPTMQRLYNLNNM